MPNWPFRFVHAADFHLEMPPFGVAEVPEHLRDLFLESAYLAAERVFETVIGEEANFLVLSGDMLRSKHTGPRGPLFLAGQFERLASHGIEVYWASGRVDSHGTWPPSIRLPENVHRFSEDKPEEMIYRREGSPLARLIGCGRFRKGRIRTADFDPAIPGLFTIAVTHGRAEPEAFKAARVDYWALGGFHDRSTVSQANPTVHYAGSPQGRQPEETGPHGCTLVQVDEHSQINVSLAPTDVIRWHTEQIEVDANTKIEDLENIFNKRTKSLIESAPGTDLLVSWKITGPGPLPVKLRRGPLATSILDQHRKQYGESSPAVWSVDIAAEPDGRPSREWYEPSTIRGDFLRTVKKLKKKSGEPLGLECYLPEEPDGGILGVAAPGDNGRRAVLQEAALLGADLLTGEEAES